MSSEMTRAPCNSCLRETAHEILGTGEHADSEDFPEGGRIAWQLIFEMLQCRGCGDVLMRRTIDCTDWGPDNKHVDYFPPPVSRRVPEWGNKLPDEFYPLMREVYAALHSDSRRLALMGARTLIDMAITDKVGDHGNFGKGLEALEKRGVISPSNRQFLEAAVEAGHAAAHRGHLPKVSELNHVMDIVENLLQAMYILEPAAQRLRDTTPKRVKPRK